jgi:hypothetical protein
MSKPNKTVWNFRHAKHRVEIEDRHFQSDEQAARKFCADQKAAGFNARVYPYKLGPKNDFWYQYHVVVWEKK